MQLVKQLETQLIVTSENEKFLSEYVDNPLTKNVANEQFERIKNAFGNKINEGFIIELSDSLRRNNFTNNRLIDSVTNLIENEDFPSIKKIIQFDKRIKVFTYDEYLRETKEFSYDYRKYYKAINVDGKLFYAHVNQLENSNLKIKYWQNENSNSGIKNYKPNDYNPLPKSFSFIDEFNKIIEEIGIGAKTEISNSPP